MREPKNLLASAQARLKENIEAADRLIERCHLALSQMDSAPSLIDSAIFSSGLASSGCITRLDPTQLQATLAQAWQSTQSAPPTARRCRPSVYTRTV
jgi:hypothetical protein